MAAEDEPENERQTMGLIEAIENAGDEDFDNVEKEIAAAETKLNALKEVRRILAAKLGKPIANPPRRRTSKPAANPDESKFGRPGSISEQRRRAMFEHIAANGPTPQSKLLKLFDIPQGSMTELLNHGFFKKMPDGWVDIIQ